MGWKPSRSSGIMFDKFMAASNKHREKISELLESNRHITFDVLKQLSKHVYHYWTNENRAHFALISKTWQKGVNDRYSIDACSIDDYYFRLFSRHKDKIYKPLRDTIENLEKTQP